MIIATYLMCLLSRTAGSNARIPDKTKQIRATTGFIAMPPARMRHNDKMIVTEELIS